MELSGRTVLLTGASRGIGPVIAEALARRGAHLALVARSAGPLREVADSLGAAGGRALSFPADLARAEERERLVERVTTEMGPVDVLINNAALENEGVFAELPWETLRETIEVNLSAPVHLTRLLLPAMLARSEGHVVQIASVAGKVGVPYDAVYSGTKAALARWTEALRREITGSGVGLSTVFPGYVTERGMNAHVDAPMPTLVGSCTPAQVAEATVQAIRHHRPDVIVNSVPLRASIALSEMFPSLGDWVLRRLGVTEYQRRKSTPRPEVTL